MIIMRRVLQWKLLVTRKESVTYSVSVLKQSMLQHLMLCLHIALGESDAIFKVTGMIFIIYSL